MLARRWDSLRVWSNTWWSNWARHRTPSKRLSKTCIASFSCAIRRSSLKVLASMSKVQYRLQIVTTQSPTWVTTHHHCSKIDITIDLSSKRGTHLLNQMVTQLSSYSMVGRAKSWSLRLLIKSNMMSNNSSSKIKNSCSKRVEVKRRNKLSKKMKVNRKVMMLMKSTTELRVKNSSDDR